MKNSSDPKCEKYSKYEDYRVQAKLDHSLFTKFYAYARRNDFNRSSALKKLLSTHPELND